MATDEASGLELQFSISVDETLESLLQSEDTDGDGRITIEDSGSKVIPKK
jgi:hypothetical protein